MQTNIVPIQTVETRTWQQDLADAITCPLQLLGLLELRRDQFVDPISAKALFPMRVPLPFIAKMEKGNPQDPLLLQVLPDHQEFIQASGFRNDPLEEQDNQHSGLLHKYRSRVLVIFRSGCAVNCRYCFRRHFPYQNNHINKQKLTKIIQYLRENPQVNEVILSGGDPLMANDQHIRWFVKQLESVPNISRFRIHSRLPVVIPNRLTDELADLLQQSRLNCVVVLHINHAHEIDLTLKLALQKFREKGITLLNQAVLLKGVNDTVVEQIKLSEALFDAGILPYYLHLLDKVAGASHFDLDEATATALVKALLVELPGFLVPKLVREVAGQPSKTPIS